MSSDNGIDFDNDEETTPIQVNPAEVETGAVKVKDEPPSVPAAEVTGETGDAAGMDGVSDAGAATPGAPVKELPPAAAGDEPEEPARAESSTQFTQAYVEQLLADQVASDQKVLNEYKAGKDRAEAQLAFERRRAELVELAVREIGDGGFARLYGLVGQYADAQMKAEKVQFLEQELTETRKKQELVDKWHKEEADKVKTLTTENAGLKQQLDKMGKEKEELAKVKEEMRGRLESFQIIQERLGKAVVPQCLSSQKWFSPFQEELLAGLRQDPISDSAALVVASLAEFSVMERNPAAACFDWKKQLSDIGLVIANYMHDKKCAEKEVVKMMRDFAQALRESDTVQKLKISLKVPDLGPDFNVEEVKHGKNGSSVAKICNWCIIDANGVYSKAIVE